MQRVAKMEFDDHLFTANLRSKSTKSGLVGVYRSTKGKLNNVTGKSEVLRASFELVSRNVRTLSGLPRQIDVRARVNLHGRGSFDRAVCAEPLAFAADAVTSMGFGFGFAGWSAVFRD